MKCPFYGFIDSSIRDPRPICEGLAIKMRVGYPECEGRLVTFKRIEVVEIIVIKRNGTKKLHLTISQAAQITNHSGKKTAHHRGVIGKCRFNIAKTSERFMEHRNFICPDRKFSNG